MLKRIVVFSLLAFTMLGGQVFASNFVIGNFQTYNPVIEDKVVELPIVVTENPLKPIEVVSHNSKSENIQAEQESVNNAESYVNALKATKTSVPAIMYHKVTDNPAEVTPYVITGTMLAEDFAEMKARGYTPITVSEYYNVQKLSQNLADSNNYKAVAEFFEKNPKPIIITFDDGYKGIYTHALPLMQQYNFKANFYICGGLIDANNPEYCTWEEIKALADSGLAEIGNHTYALHNRTKADLANIYQTSFKDALNDINANKTVILEKTGVLSNVLSFPYGQYDHITIQRLKSAGYEIFISTDYRTNMLRDEKAALGRFNRDTQYSAKEFFDLVDSMCNRLSI